VALNRHTVQRTSVHRFSWAVSGGDAILEGLKMDELTRWQKLLEEKLQTYVPNNVNVKVVV
jgi:hypothetical protein